MIMIVGLGNPGLKYRHTRHNAGFDGIDYLAKTYHIDLRKHEHKAITGKGMLGGQQVLLVKPQTFMNNSGESVGALVSYYGLDPKTEVIILSDDVTLDCGTLRIRRKGSAGGHNGLKSINLHLGTEDYARIKIGVGKLPDGGDMVKHVLGHLKGEERKALDESIERLGGALELMVTGQMDKAMNLYNSKG